MEEDITMGTVRSVRLDKAMNMHTSASTWMMTTEERKRYERKVIYIYVFVWSHVLDGRK